MPQVLQKKKSFPFGTAVNCWKYNANAAEGKYRDFIHQHFNWVVPQNALKWMITEPQRVRLCVTEVTLYLARCVGSVIYEASPRQRPGVRSNNLGVTVPRYPSY